MEAPSETRITTLRFQGVELLLPLDVPFSYSGDALVLDFTAGFRGKLCLHRAPPTQPHAGPATALEPFPALAVSDVPTQLYTCGGEDMPTEELVQSWFYNSPGCQLDSQPASAPRPSQAVPILSSSSVERPVTPADALAPLPKPPASTGSQEDVDVQKTASKVPAPVEGTSHDKENVTPPVAAPGRKGRGSTSGADKRKPDSGASRSSKRARAAALADGCSDLEFSWTQVTFGAEDSVAISLPSPRWGSSLTISPDGKVCLYGGAYDEGQLGDTWMLDLAKMQWNRLIDDTTQNKAWHAVAPVAGPAGERLLAFGGERCIPGGVETTSGTDGEEEAEALNETSLLDPDLQLWVPITLSGEDGKCLPKRAGHTLTQLSDGRALMCCGLDENGKFRNDVYVLDARRKMWMSLSGIIKGSPPKPRAYHTATLVGDRIIVLGGMGPTRAWSFKEVYSLTPGTWSWREHTTDVEGDVPTPRSGHSAVALPGGRHLLVFGGGTADDDLFLSSVHVLDTVTWRWAQISMPGHQRPCGRSGHGMVVAEREGRPVLVLHGGRTKGDALLQDTWLLEMQ